MAYYITAHDAKFGGSRPPEVIVDTELIESSDEEIDAALPKQCRRAGTLIYVADYSKIKCRDLNGEWVQVGE